jgi:hypothetical protein
MSSASIPLLGISDAATVELPLLGPKKNAISGSPMEYCLEVAYCFIRCLFNFELTILFRWLTTARRKLAYGNVHQVLSLGY